MKAPAFTPYTLHYKPAAPPPKQPLIFGLLMCVAHSSNPQMETIDNN